MSLRYFYNSLLLIRDFIVFGFSARSIDTADSPYLYSFIENVLRQAPSKQERSNWKDVEDLREQLRNDKRQIKKSNIGAESKVKFIPYQSIADITKSSVSNYYKCQILYGITKHYQPKKVLELGSSLGISTRYISTIKSVETIVSIEGDKAIHEIAQSKQTNDKISFVNSLFNEALENLIESQKVFDMILIDGDHQYQSTILYKDQCEKILDTNGLLVFDDIYWSNGMKKAWEEIKLDTRFNIVIDLFYFGIVTYDPKIKENINIKILPSRRRWQIGMFR